MNIGTAAAKSGVPTKTIRYYESIGLIDPAARTPGGYRKYGDGDVQTLRFIQRARSLGFSIKEVGGLLALWRAADGGCARAKALALAHLAEIDRRIDDLRSVRNHLARVIEKCPDQADPECAILADLMAPQRGSRTARPQKKTGFSKK